MPSIHTIPPATLRAWHHAPGELAVVDLREEIDFSTGSIFFSSCLPLSRLELLLADRIPRPGTRIVITDAPDGAVERGARRLAELGYTDIHILEGGVAGWRAAGHPVYTGVHVPSKAFAEVIEETLHTPAIDVEELVRRQSSGTPLVVIDSRTTEEYQRNTVPGAFGVPGADLLRHIRDLVPDDTTPVVVNCGGRTRSIIGAQALRNAGLTNPVVSLRGGLLAWRLAGLEPETGANRIPVSPSAAAIKWAETSSQALAARAGLREIDAAQLAEFRTDTTRTTYLFDVRRPEAYAAGHLPGALPAQGGQLVQETDSHAVVHGARVVLADDGDLSQARLTGSWLLQSGLKEVFVLSDGLGDGPLDTGAHRPAVLGLQATFTDPGWHESPHSLSAALAAGTTAVVDIDLAARHRVGHIPGAWLARRVELEKVMDDLPPTTTVVLASDDGVLASIAAAALRTATIRSIRWLAGGTRAWAEAGLPLETGVPRALGQGGTDAWLPPTQRDGDKAAHAREYLDWELGLPAQVTQDPDVHFAPLLTPLEQGTQR